MATNSTLSPAADARGSSTVVALLVLVLTSIVSIGLYRLYFHPLAKYPGPFWAKLSAWPSYWHTLQGDRHVWLWRLQQEYGSTFRYRPDGVVINTPQGFRTIFGPKGNVKKGIYYEVWPRNVHAVNTWDVTSVVKHGRKRRVLNQAFSDKALRSAEVFVNQHTERWCELIGERADKTTGWTDSLNMSEWSNYLVFDILGDLCFGKSFDMKEPGSDMRFVPELLVSFLELVHPIAFSPFAPLWVWLKPRGLDWIFENTKPAPLKKWTNFVDTCLAERVKVEDELNASSSSLSAADTERAARKDFFHYLAGAVDPETGERGYEKNELFGECELLIIAGSDTTSIVFAGMFFYLARNPEVQAKVAAEVRAAFSSSAEVRAGPALHGCRYLKAFIQEACRMTPPVAAEPSREVLPGGAQVGGHVFPAGTLLSTGLYALSYNADVYPEPFAFRPERWLPEHATADAIALAESGFCAFSAGSRGCPGKNLAMMEMTLVMAKLVWAYELRQDQSNLLGGGGRAGLGDKMRKGRECEGQFQIFDAFVAVRHGPMVQFKKRE